MFCCCSNIKTPKPKKTKEYLSLREPRKHTQEKEPGMSFKF